MNQTFVLTMNKLFRIGLPGAVVQMPTILRRTFLLNVPVPLDEDQCRTASERFRVRRGECQLVVVFYPATQVEPSADNSMLVTEGQGWTVVENFGVPGLTMTFEQHRVTLELPGQMSEDTCQHANQLITALSLQRPVDVKFISDPFAGQIPTHLPQSLLLDGRGSKQSYIVSDELAVHPTFDLSPKMVPGVVGGKIWNSTVDGFDVNQVMHAVRRGFRIFQAQGSERLVLEVPLKADSQECQRRTSRINNMRFGIDLPLTILFPDVSTSSGPQFYGDERACVASFPLQWPHDQRQFITRIVNRAIDGWSVQINFVPAVDL